jgi:hypothetical protein
MKRSIAWPRRRFSGMKAIVADESGAVFLFSPGYVTGLRDLLYQATIYWHAIGFECDRKLNP